MSDTEKTRQEALQMIEDCSREMQEAMRVEKPDLAAAFGAMATTAGMAFLLGLHKPSESATVSTCDDYPECERERDRMRARIAELEAEKSSANQWLGPHKSADEALDALRCAVAEMIGADPEAWPVHKNATLAIAAALGLRMADLNTARGLIQQALEALEYHREQTRPIDRSTAAINALRAHLGMEPTQ